MAPSFFKGIKGGNLSCASPGSLAVCTSIDRRSMVRPAIVSRAIERGTKPLEVAPKPTSNPKKSARKSSEYRNGSSSITGNKDLISPASSSRYLLTDSAFFDIFPELEPDLDLDLDLDPAEPSLVPRVAATPSPALIKHHGQVSAPSASSPRLLRGCSRGREAPSPYIRRSSSSRTTTARRDHDLRVWAPSLVPITREKPSPAILKAASSTTTTGTHHDQDQVVVLRVSLHCKGCEGKVRKHVSKMEGVRSFSIDFEAKKVTVTGNVTPLGVLNSVSKVKNAQFWPSSSLSSPSPSPSPSPLPRSSASF